MTTHAPGEGSRTAKTPSASRLAYIDNLRVLLTVLVVLHHAALTYGNIPMWFYAEPANDASGGLLDVFVGLNQTYFMGLFFMVSGIFVPGSVDRRGSKSFLRGRLVRLGVPLLLFLLLMRPIIAVSGYLDDAAGELPYWLYLLITWTPGPMWFVEALLVFSLAYVMIRSFRPPEHTLIAQRRTGRLPGPVAIAGFTLVLIAATYLWRLLVPIGSYWPIVGLPTPDYLAQYALLFTVGALAYRRGWFDAIPRAAGLGGLATVIAALVLLAPIAGTSFEEAMVRGSFASLVMSTFESVFAVGMILFLLWLFQRFVNRQGHFGRFLSDNAYAVYFLHTLVLVAIGVALSGWDAPAVTKFAALAVLAVPTTWIGAALIRAIPGATRVF
ncbi:acyltransferase family protein [Spiractinospora alimapuensis]|uniref:acyltransferase family protein n=1 Tax=Spiractinospora alimapuensis TaxID=2820884 RepID=UPI001F390FC3|nr:acyltransferase family protein [Spiractinospora alimapuensis]QVQ53432.1 acyltransferase family protein [Spiractinospora alimapuensis]